MERKEREGKGEEREREVEVSAMRREVYSRYMFMYQCEYGGEGEAVTRSKQTIV